MKVILPWVSVHDDHLVLSLKVKPGARKSAWVGVVPEATVASVTDTGGPIVRLALSVAAPPVDGEGNEEVVRFIRKSLKPFGADRVEILRGHSNPRKDVAVYAANPKLVLQELLILIAALTHT